jgi:hypothetical protein
MSYLKIILTLFLLRFSGSVLDSGNSYTSGRHASLLAAATTSRAGQNGLTGNGDTTQVSGQMAILNFTPAELHP